MTAADASFCVINLIMINSFCFIKRDALSHKIYDGTFLCKSPGHARKHNPIE